VIKIFGYFREKVLTYRLSLILDVEDERIVECEALSTHSLYELALKEVSFQVHIRTVNSKL
jgi:hypothetical protein